MYTHEELLKAISTFEPSESLSNQTKAEIKTVATQIGFNTPDASCRCKEKYNDLIIKLRLWARDHQEPVHYTMQRGIIRKGPDGKNIFALNLDDSKALWLLENDPEAPKYIKRIADDEPVQEPAELFESSTEQLVPEIPAETKTKKKSKKKH